MGTVLEVTVEARNAAEARDAVDALFELAERLERIFSRHDPDSDVSRLNSRAGTGPVEVAPELALLLGDAIDLAHRTGGAFDVTVGPLVALWTEAGRTGRVPDGPRLREARSRVGSRGIRIGDDGRVELARAGMAVDLGGLAKGWALDRMREALAARGIERALLSFGQSSLLAVGNPAGASGWRVLLRDPHGGYAGIASLRDASLSVSGSFGASTRIEGRSYGHVIDPRTGRPLTRASQATVLAPSGALGEALTKALLVLEPAEGLGLLAAEGIEGLLLTEDGGRHATPGFDRAARFEPLRTRTPDGDD